MTKIKASFVVLLVPKDSSSESSESDDGVQMTSSAEIRLKTSEQEIEGIKKSFKRILLA